jgi:hypothetical protein
MSFKRSSLFMNRPAEVYEQYREGLLHEKPQDDPFRLEFERIEAFGQRVEAAYRDGGYNALQTCDRVLTTFLAKEARLRGLSVQKARHK